MPHLSADNVDALVDLAGSTPVGRLGVAVAAWLHRHDDPDEIARRQHRERSASWRTDPDGMVTIAARLGPADAGAVCAVIDRQVMRAPTGAASEGEPEPLAADEPEAVGADNDTPASRVDTELVVHVTAEGNHLTDGTSLGDHAVTALLPDVDVMLTMLPPSGWAAICW